MSDEPDTAPEAPAAPAPARRAFTVKNFIEADKLRMDISYSLTDLSNAMMQQASLFIHYSMLAAKASKQVDDVKLLLDTAEAKVDRLLRDKAAADGVKLTEPQLERALRAHGSLIRMRQAVNEARQVEAVCKAAARGFEQRRDMLIQHGARERKEMEGEVRTMARSPSEAAARVASLRAV